MSIRDAIAGFSLLMAAVSLFFSIRGTVFNRRIKWLEIKMALQLKAADLSLAVAQHLTITKETLRRMELRSPELVERTRKIVTDAEAHAARIDKIRERLADLPLPRVEKVYDATLAKLHEFQGWQAQANAESRSLMEEADEAAAKATAKSPKGTLE